MQQARVRAPIIGVTIFLACALMVRAFLQIELGKLGYAQNFAKDLSYLVVPPILALLLLPILRANANALQRLFARDGLHMRDILRAITIGLLARAAFWCWLVFRVSTGVSGGSSVVIAEPEFSFACPPAAEFLLGLLVWIGLVPLVEELTHRGLIQGSLLHRGRWSAIVISTLIFTAFHAPTTMPVAAVMGLILALQFANSGTLWAPLITHATYDGLIQFDWHCLRGAWNPAAADLPLLAPALASLVGLLAALGAVAYLLHRTGAQDAPRSGSPTRR